MSFFSLHFSFDCISPIVNMFLGVHANLLPTDDALRYPAVGGALVHPGVLEELCSLSQPLLPVSPTHGNARGPGQWAGLGGYLAPPRLCGHTNGSFSGGEQSQLCLPQPWSTQLPSGTCPGKARVSCHQGDSLTSLGKEPAPAEI